MDIATYEKIVASIASNSWDFDKVYVDLIEEFPLERRESLRGILSQEYQRHVKKCFKSFCSIGKKEAVYRSIRQPDSAGQPGGHIVDYAQRAKYSSALTAKIVVEEYLADSTEQAMNTNIKSRTNMLMKDTTLIEDGRLALEVFLATIKDNSYGPIAEAIKCSIGEEHEQKIKDCLDKLEIPFSDENVMRGQGFDKTPDVKLEIPIAVDGHVINWIESKALFGDPETHHGYLSEQFWSYTNRFGPGMVIYWSGYITQLDTNKNAGIILKDHFPRSIVRYRPDIIRTYS